MARAQVTHSIDAVQITFRGDKRQPEPSTAVIQFPGGHVEVSRCSDGTYWAHITVVAPQNTVASRVDYDYEGYSAGAVRPGAAAARAHPACGNPHCRDHRPT
jgi:hypothetical protein